jgi:hypothetical protein
MTAILLHRVGPAKNMYRLSIGSPCGAISSGNGALSASGGRIGRGLLNVARRR